MADDSLKILHLITTRLVNETVNYSKKYVSTESQEFKNLKKEVRENEHIIPEYIEYLFESMKTSDDSERRQALLSLFDYFFNRSHRFRLKTVERLQDLLLLVCETDPKDHPLPGPMKEAKQLKAYALKTVTKWHEKFGPGYEKLNYVSDFLRDSKVVGFDSASADLTDRMRKQEENRRNAELQKTVAHIRRKFDDARPDIEQCMASIDTALSILVPVFCTESSAEARNGSGIVTCPSRVEDTENVQTAHGYAGFDTISVVIKSLTPEVIINEDNEAIVESVRDAKVMLDVYRNKILSWQRQLNGAACSEPLARNLTLLKKQIDLRCAKIAELKLKPKKQLRKGAYASDSEESDLEDLPDKQLEDFMPPDHVPRHSTERVHQLEKANRSDQPCSGNSAEGIPSGSKQRAERRCKARNGEVCPRMGSSRCPVHGKIVGRDEEDFPLEEMDSAEMSGVQAEREHLEEKYLRDLEAATGKSFISRRRKKRKREATVRERLEKKLLNPRTIKRVSAILDAACKANLERNYGDQFAHRPSL